MATNEVIIQKLGKLKSVLLTSGLQKENQPLYQVINQLIDALIGVANATITAIDDSSGSSADLTAIEAAQLLTSGDETTTFPNSRELLAGTNVSFDDSVANERTINVADAAVGVEWDVLTNGDAASPEIIFADGEVIMVHIP